MMGRPIYIFGAGGLGREIKAMLDSMPDWHVVGYYDDQLLKGTYVDEVECLGGVEILAQIKSSIDMIVAIGDPLVKWRVISKLSEISYINYPTIVHPSAQLFQSGKIKVGEGTVISAGCILTTDIILGKHVLINLNATVGHDTKIGDGSSIMPGVNIAGQVSIGTSVLIGSGANVMNGVRLGDECRIGAGAVVTKDVPMNITVIGVPAKPLIK